MIETAQSKGIKVLLCGMETPPLRSWNYSVAFHRIFPRLAEKYRIPLVPFLLQGVALNPDMNGDDGIHPNAAGARAIADTIWSYLEPLL
jgi:acyl-CoA thioesterase-1